jgi:SAM-dependent methyltransferase
MAVETWYKSWFNTPYYHLLYRNRDMDEAAAFIDTVLKYLNPAPGARVLDLACGKGRHSIYMASKGYDVTGIDLSEQNIAHANAFSDEHLHFFVHDMLLPFRENGFDYILNLFTSFGYFDTDKENLQTLQSAYTNLKPKGTILIDFLNVQYVKSHLIEKEEINVDGVDFKISRELCDGNIIKHIHVTDNGITHHFEERIKALSKQDFVGLMNRANFTIDDIFGDYHLAQHNETHSPRLIIIARKKR